MNDATPAPPTHVDVGGLPVAQIDTAGLLDWLASRHAQGQGAWLVTANTDFISRGLRDPQIAGLYRQADLIVADGMPLVWAARLRGTPLPERIAGSTLMFELAERAARSGWRVFLLGGVDGNEQRAARLLQETYPGLQIAGTAAPWVSATPTEDELAGIREALDASGTVDVVLVAFGSPKQEHVARALRKTNPRWILIGVGASFALATGDLARAPVWMQRAGLEWTHRMVQEPGRLVRRYLVDNLPVALRLCARALADRWRGRA